MTTMTPRRRTAKTGRVIMVLEIGGLSFMLYCHHTGRLTTMRCWVKLWSRIFDLERMRGGVMSAC